MITLKTLEKATAQEVFDQIVEHLRQQKQKSQDKDNFNICLYRSPSGLKCAAGCLIADDEYCVSMEGKLWAGLDIPIAHRDLILTMQNIHDCYSVNEWEIQFKIAAMDFNLKYERNIDASVDHSA